MRSSARRQMKYSLIPRLGTMVVVWLALLAWHLSARQVGCAPLGLYFGFLTLVLAMSGSEYGYARRRAFLNEYLIPGGWLFRLLDGRLPILARELAKSAVLAVVLLIGALMLEARQWSLLLADALVLSLVLPRFMDSVGGVIREEYRYVMARRWAIWISTLLLWSESLLVMLFSSRSDYLGLRWQEVISYAAPLPRLACSPMAELAEYAALLDTLGSWATQNLARQGQDPSQALMAWLGWLIALGLAFLFAWAYSQLIVGTLTRPWVAWRNMPRDPPGERRGRAPEA